MTLLTLALPEPAEHDTDLLPIEEVVAIASADELAERVRRLAVAQLRPALNAPVVSAEATECRDLIRDLLEWVDEVTR